MKLALTFLLVTLFFLIIPLQSLRISPTRMFAALGQFASSSQFYLFGRNRCTRTGWEKASKAYPKPDILQDGPASVVDLSNKVFMITGANGGIGKEVTSFLAAKNATVYMVCRSLERGQAARDEIAAQAKNEKVHLIVGDCGLEKDVRRIWSDFVAHRQTVDPEKVQLDALVCNAGALMNELTLTEEEIEVTFATHLLFGTYLLGSLAMPTLKATPGARMIAVSSGGMYNSKFPAWDVATSTGNAKYDGQFAYVYAKRGQVLLCEQWAKEHGDEVKIVSCHPGWVDTGGVDKAYGENKKYLEPLRSLWQGSEGIIWLCIGPAEQIESGAFYLDRAPQVKHLSGPFFTEGSFTKNTPQETFEMMINLQQWANGDRPSFQQLKAKAATEVPLVASTSPIDLNAFMGNWYVLANIPTSMEVGAANCIEMYELDAKRPNTVKVTFEYSFANAGSTTTPFTTSQMKMRGNVKNTTTNTFWTIDPKMLGLAVPLGMSYLILDTAEDYSYTMVSVPDRSYLWIMIRSTPSEFPPANVKVIDAYPELHMDGFSSVKDPVPLEDTGMVTKCSATDSAAGADKADKVEAKSTEATPAAVDASADSSSSSQPTQTKLEINTTTSSPAVAAVAETYLTQLAKKQHEVAILQRALARATELGFDVTKILRTPWFAQLEKKAVEEGKVTPEAAKEINVSAEAAK